MSNEALVSLLHALAEPNRLAVVRRLHLEGEVACSAFDFGLSRATWSYHFKTLRLAGLTVTKNRGVSRTLSLRRDAVDKNFPGLLDAVIANVK